MVAPIAREAVAPATAGGSRGPAPGRAARQRELVPGIRTRAVGILGLGAYVPEGRLSNADLARCVDTSDEWIVTRTGIRERRIAASDRSTSDLALEAARGALRAAGLDPLDLQLILLATATPDQPTPPTVCHVQRGLGAERAAGFDLNAACSGFINALMVGHRLVASGAFENALILGADKLSSITDYQDRDTCVLFGDGAGAVVIGADAPGAELIDHVVGIDGRGSDMIRVSAGGSREPASHATVDRRAHYLELRGREVFRFAVQKICELVPLMCDRNGLVQSDLKLVVPHQANRRILEAASRALGLDPRRMFLNLECLGNTSNASIPMALDEAVRLGRLASGDLALLVAFGGGLSWGATLIRW